MEEQNPLEVNWQEFGEALEYFGDTFKKLSGHGAKYKDKYGTLRFEYEHLWLNTDADRYHAALALLLTVNKYPDHVNRISDDALWELLTDLPEETYRALYKK